MPKEKRKRNWTFVVYADSAPENWVDLLREQQIPAFISPFHDCDTNPDGEKKKPHWHVILMFSGFKTEEQAQEVSNLCSGVKVQVVKDIVGACRYLCHMDNPEKAQYSVGDVISIAGADYIEKVSKACDTDKALDEMLDWCAQNTCYSFKKLTDYARKNRSDWFRVLSASRTVFLTAWLRSYEWELKQEASAQRVCVIDCDTGEKLAEFDDKEAASDYCEYLATIGRDARLA